MSCGEHYLNLVHQKSNCRNPAEELSISKISSSFLCAAAADELCNSSSNAILSRELGKANAILDDQTNVDNFSSAIEHLLNSKAQAKHCKTWKSDLRNTVTDLVIEDDSKCPHSKKALSCQIDYLNEEELMSLSRNRLRRNDIPLPKPVQSQFCKRSFDDGANHKPSELNRAIVPSRKIKPPIQTAGPSNAKPQIGFKTARSELINQNLKGNTSKQSVSLLQALSQKRSLGARGAPSRFVSPMITNEQQSDIQQSAATEQIEDERLKNIDPKMVELIRSEIIDHGSPIVWDDIAGLEFAKTVIQEAVVWPLLRPDIFTGLRRPPKGILLFGPPGTGKTLIGKCIASQCSATFFSISASSLTSKWLGDGEKMVRALFAVARCHQPAVVFIDEIDSLLTQRSDSEHESTRRIKTEFLVQLDGAATAGDDRLLLIGATNRPQELDEAARRRLVKRLYIPLPDYNARCQIVQRLMITERHSLCSSDVEEVANLAQGFSGADMQSLCSEAALQPIRAVPLSQIASIQSDQVRPVTVEDFKFALKRVRPSVSGADLHLYEEWDRTYGSGTAHHGV